MILMNKYTDAPRTLLDGWTVLVIDDHKESQEIISDILTFYSAEVVFADDGQEGFAKALETQPKFIISDISMPILDGWGLIKLLKNESRTASIPTIALTAHAMVSDRQRAISEGFHNYLSKPLNPFTFLSEILILLDDVDTISQELETRLNA